MKAGQIIRLYKDLQVEFGLFLCAGILIAILMIMVNIKCIVVVFAASCYFYCCVIYLGVKALKRLAVTAALLNTQCRAGDYVQQMLALMERAKGSYIRLFLSSNLAAGYLNLGDVDNALFYLQSVTIDTKKRQPRSVGEILIRYYNNYATVYMRKGNLEMADAMLERMQNQIYSIRMSPASRQEYEKNYERKQLQMQMLRGGYEGVEEYCQRELKTEQTMLIRVFLYDFLREVYLHEGKQAEAEKCCDFILKNGGDTYYAARIRDGSIG